jgi:hypothetical protein
MVIEQRMLLFEMTAVQLSDHHISSKKTIIAEKESFEAPWHSG